MKSINSAFFFLSIFVTLSVTFVLSSRFDSTFGFTAPVNSFYLNPESGKVVLDSNGRLAVSVYMNSNGAATNRFQFEAGFDANQVLCEGAVVALTYDSILDANCNNGGVTNYFTLTTKSGNTISKTYNGVKIGTFYFRFKDGIKGTRMIINDGFPSMSYIVNSSEMLAKLTIPPSYCYSLDKSCIPTPTPTPKPTLPPTPVPTPTPIPPSSFNIPVLVMKYFPVVDCYLPKDKIDMSAASVYSNDGSANGVIDGNTAGGTWHPSPPFPHDYFVIDMGSVNQVGAISVYFYGQDRPERYHVEASQTGFFNGEQQTIVTEFLGLQNIGDLGRKDYVVSNINARFIKFVIDGYRNGNDDGLGSQVNLNELEIYQDSLRKSCLDKVTTGAWDIKSTPEMEDPLSQVRSDVNQTTQLTKTGLTNGSSLHLYKNSTSEPVLNYTIYEEKEYLKPVPVKIIFDENRADHLKMFAEDVNVCDYVENKGVKEVWVWMYDSDAVHPVESYQNGPYGGQGNGYMQLPRCRKTYTVYDYNYQGGVGDTLEDHTHHIEVVLGNVDSNTWEGLFVGPWGQRESYRCGWTHCPPNTQLDCHYPPLVHNYDWANEKRVLSDCEDWKVDGSGVKDMVSCHNWAGAVCGQDAGDKFKVWWMQNIPQNWWIWIGDYDWARANMPWQLN